MSAHFFHGSLDDDIRRELNKYLQPLQDFVNRNQKIRITGVFVKRVDYDSIETLLNLFDRENKIRQLRPSPLADAKAIGFFGPNGWVKILPVD